MNLASISNLLSTWVVLHNLTFFVVVVVSQKTVSDKVALMGAYLSVVHCLTLWFSVLYLE